MNEFVCDFPIGNLNQKYKNYFDGDSWIARLSEKNTQVIINNVTFAPGSRNHWHIHHGVQQILVCVGGAGWYQEWGKQAIAMQPGDVICIPLGIKHWHGARKDCWFAHLSLISKKDLQNGSTEWLESVCQKEYEKL